MTNEEKINEILSRGVAETIHPEKIKEKLLSGINLRVKFGIDPTSPNIHIGRATAIWKLRELQDLGHTIVFIIGDFTGVIGDTSDKESERPMLTKEVVEKNLATYFEQAGKVLDMSKVEKHRNTEWLEGLKYRDITEHAEVFSLSDFIARENIKLRLEKGSRISLRELMYPLMQGYDSVAINADIEIGGTDQKFNMLAGRRLQEHFKKEPQNILMLSLIEGLDGRKMSSSWGNTININDEPNDMFGKVMSLRDELIIKYFINVTRIPMNEVKETEEMVAKGGNPRDAKLKLAKEIVSMYYGKEQAEKAHETFLSTFQKKEIPDEMLEIEISEGVSLADLLVQREMVASKGEFRRLVEEGAVKILKNEREEEKILDYNAVASVGVYKIGKRRFVRIV